MHRAQPLQHQLTFRVPIYTGFLLTGMATTMLGAILPVIASHLGRRPIELGFLFTSQFLGSTAGTLLTGFISERHGLRAPLSVGYALMGIGVGWVLFASWPWVFFAVAAYGIGIGFVIPASNMLVAEASLDRTASVSRLNACWASGAILLPIIVAAALKEGQLTAMMLAGGVVMVAWSGWVLLVQLPAARFTSLKKDALQQRGDVIAAIVFAALFFLYVGTETSIAGWIAEYSHRMGLEHAWVLVPSLFWVCLVAGRVIASTILRQISEHAVCVAGLALSVTGGFILVQARSSVGVIVGGAVCGFGLAAVFPIFIAMLPGVLGDSSRRIAGTTFAVAGVGGATLPWCVGALADATGGMAWGLLVPIAASSAMLLLVVANPRFFNTPTVERSGVESGQYSAEPESR